MNIETSKSSLGLRGWLTAVAFAIGLLAPNQTRAELWGPNQFILADQAFLYVFDTNFNAVRSTSPCGIICGSFAGSLDWYPNGDLMVATMSSLDMYVVRHNRDGQQTHWYRPEPHFLWGPQETKLSFNGRDIYTAVTASGGDAPRLRRFGLDPGGAYEYLTLPTMGGLVVVPRLNGAHELWFGLDPETASYPIIYPLCPTGEISFTTNCYSGGPGPDSQPAGCHSMSYDPERHRVLFSNLDDGKIYAMDVESRALVQTYVVPANQHTNTIDFTGITTGPGGMVVAVESYPFQNFSYHFRRVGLSVWDADGSNYRFIDLEGTILIDRTNGLFPKNILWTGHSPEFKPQRTMAVQSGGLIVNGDTTPATSDGTDFGSTKVAGGTVTHTFIVWNFGPENLDLDSVLLSGPNAADFRVTTPPASQVAPSNTTTFQVTFDSSARGARSAMVTFANTASNENPFSFAIQGWGLGEGDVDRDFNPGVSNAVNSLAVQADGKIVAGGGFTNISGAAHNFFTRLQPNGSSDTNFNASGNGPNSTVYATAVQPDGKIIMGGNFTSVNGTLRNRFARLNANGSLDTTALNVNGTVYGIALQPDGKVLIAGEFTAVSGLSRNHLARINANGALDAAFNPSTAAEGVVYSLALQPDGEILIGGELYFTNDSANYLARFTANGFRDSGFSTSTDGAVYAMAIQPDGKIVIGGAFSAVNGMGRNYLARLNPDGTVDTGFDPSLDGDVLSVALQADGKLVIGGTFTTVASTTRLRLARLNADGTLDQDLNPGVDGSVLSLALQADGGILTGGNFSTVGGLPRARLAQVLNGPATSTLSVSNATRIQWLRGGTAPETPRVSFDVSTNGGTTWTTVGAGTRIAGGWELTGLNLPTNGVVCARAYPVSGQFNGSSGLVEEQVSFPEVAPPSLLTGITRQPNRAMLIIGAGSPNLRYVLESTSDLASGIWQPVQTNNASSSGNLNFLDATATNSPLRFYRVKGL